MADIDKLLERNWQLESLTAVLIKNADKKDEDGDSLAKRKALKLDTEDLATLANADSKDDKKTIRALRQRVKELEAGEAKKQALKAKLKKG
jgi:hypothetical protein